MFNLFNKREMEKTEQTVYITKQGGHINDCAFISVESMLNFYECFNFLSNDIYEVKVKASESFKKDKVYIIIQPEEIVEEIKKIEYDELAVFINQSHKFIKNKKEYEYFSKMPIDVYLQYIEKTFLEALSKVGYSKEFIPLLYREVVFDCSYAVSKEKEVEHIMKRAIDLRKEDISLDLCVYFLMRER